MSEIKIPERAKELVAAFRTRRLTKEEAEELQAIGNGIREEHARANGIPPVPEPRDVYVTDANGELVLDNYGYPIPKAAK
jgi:hypothetical protein